MEKIILKDDGEYIEVPIQVKKTAIESQLEDLRQELAQNLSVIRNIEHKNEQINADILAVQSQLDKFTSPTLEVVDARVELQPVLEEVKSL